MIQGNKDYIQPFKNHLTDYLKFKKEKHDLFIFYVIYKGIVKRFIVDFSEKDLSYIVSTVLHTCLLMGFENNCDLEDLIITDNNEVIFI